MESDLLLQPQYLRERWRGDKNLRVRQNTIAIRQRPFGFFLDGQGQGLPNTVAPRQAMAVRARRRSLAWLRRLQYAIANMATQHMALIEKQAANPQSYRLTSA